MPEGTEVTESGVSAEFNELAVTLLDLSTEELFENYACSLTKADSAKIDGRRVELALGAAIGFTGEFVRGVLAIALDDGLAAKVNPLSSGGQEGCLNDWIGEIANQLLGRLKNKLLGFNIELAMSTPVVVQGSHIKIGTLHRKSTHLTFSHGENTLELWWDAEVDPALEISEEEAPDVQLEGEMVMF